MPEHPSRPSSSPVNAALRELSERADGPPLYAVWGDHRPSSDFQLGTRETDWHTHLRGQMFCIEDGLIHVRTPQGSWLLPPHRAGWIPPGMPHTASISGVTRGWNVIITPQASRCLPLQPCVFGVTELLRALVRRVTDWGAQDSPAPAQRRLVRVLLDEIQAAPHEPLHLPMPTDRRLLRVAQAVLAAPGDTRTLVDWAAWAGMSSRTLSRLCQAELGSSFAQWRQQAGLVHALEALARGEAVAQVADTLGYATPSNFIAMFRRVFGTSPARYFAQRSGGITERRAGIPT